MPGPDTCSKLQDSTRIHWSQLSSNNLFTTRFTAVAELKRAAVLQQNRHYSLSTANLLIQSVSIRSECNGQVPFTTSQSWNGQQSHTDSRNNSLTHCQLASVCSASDSAVKWSEPAAARGVALLTYAIKPTSDFHHRQTWTGSSPTIPITIGTTNLRTANLPNHSKCFMQGTIRTGSSTTSGNYSLSTADT